MMKELLIQYRDNCILGSNQSGNTRTNLGILYQSPPTVAYLSATSKLQHFLHHRCVSSSMFLSTSSLQPERELFATFNRTIFNNVKYPRYERFSTLKADALEERGFTTRVPFARKTSFLFKVAFSRLIWTLLWL